jgi:predicted component of type VI protein secretion system
MPAQLVSLDSGASILLDKPILLVGRHPECDIQIDSRKISRRHCCIAQVANYLVIRDLGSTNGIRINGNRVSEGKLEPGDEVTIGNNRYQLSWESIAPDALPHAPVKVRPDLAPNARPPKDSPLPLSGKQPRRRVDEMLEECDEPIPLSDDDEDEPNPLAQRTPPSDPGEPPSPAVASNNAGDSRIPADSLNLIQRPDVVPPSDAGHAPAV